jgi:hypothetical protein
MSMLFGGAPMGSLRAGLSGGNSSGNRTQALARQGYAPFSNPFFDLASTYTPPTIKGLFAYCRHFHLSHGIINAIITKASEYPVTDLIVSHKDASVKARWEELFLGVMNWRVHQFEINLDYYVYGNAFVSPSLPFTKMLTCRACNKRHVATKTRPNWRYNSRGFWLSCSSCGQSTYAIAYDEYYPRLGEISITRWNPELVSTFYNESTGRTDYTLDFSHEFKNGVTLGRKDLVSTTPQVILDAIKAQKTLVFDSNAVFHMRRPGLSNMAGWGIPLMMPVLKDAFFMQVLKKSQEAVMLGHLIPQVFLFPQPATSGADPFCVAPDTLIETHDGLRPAEEIRVGDYLRSHTNKWRRVEGVLRRPVAKGERTFRVVVQTMGAFPLELSEEHPLLAVPNTTKDGDRSKQKWVEPEFIEVQKLKQYDYVAYPVDELPTRVTHIDLADYLGERAVTENWVYKGFAQGTAEAWEFEEARGWAPYGDGERKAMLAEHGWTENEWFVAYRAQLDGREPNRLPRYMEITEELATLVGYFLSEGSIGEGKNAGAIRFAFHTNEVAYHEDVDRCVRALGFEKGTVVRQHPTAQGAYVCAHNVMLAELLGGLCGRGAKTKRVPQEIVDAGRERIVEMLRSLWAGDGSDHVCVRGRERLSLGLANPHIVVEARRLLLSFGLIGGIHLEERVVAGTPCTSYKLVYAGEQARSLRRLLAEGASAPRHNAPRMPGVFRDGYILLPVKKIEASSIKEVIGFQMHGDRSFCVPACATHNTTVSLANWRDHIRMELTRQRQDPNYFAILPFPLGHQQIGGDGKSLLLTPEITSQAEQICIGMNFPVDLIMGNGNYASSSVNMRMLENFFLSNMHGHVRLLHWAFKHFGSFLNWPTPDGRFKPFRMADDLQRAALYFQLNQADKISDSTLLSQIDLKVDDETKLRVQELAMQQEAARKKAETQAEVQGAAAVIMANYQAQAQAAMAAATARFASNRNPFQKALGSGSEGPTGVTLDAVAAALAEAVRRMPPEQQAKYMQQLRTESPEMEQLVAQQQGAGLPPAPGMEGQPPAGPQAAAQQGQSDIAGAPSQPFVNMDPLPEQLPPRRAGAV